MIALAGWISRQQQDVIEYLQEENRVLRSKLKGKRIRFTDDERRRPAVKGKLLGRKILEEVTSTVTPDTILRWHRMLIVGESNPESWQFSILSYGRGHFIAASIRRREGDILSLRLREIVPMRD